jgi:cell division septation protein DedD
MDPGLKQRLVGAAVLVALAVIFLPMLVQGPAPDSGVSDVPLTMPDAPQGEYETRDLPLVTPGNAPDGGAVGMDSGQPAASASQALPLEGSDAAGTAEPLEATPAGAPLPADSGATGGNEMFPAATAGGDYAVSFGSFTTTAAADAVDGSLRASQLPGYREAAQVDGKAVQRVRIGPYATRAEAEAARLRAAHVRDDVGARVVVLDAEATGSKPAPAAAKPAVPAAKPVAVAPPPQPAAPAAPATAGIGFAVQLAAFSKPADATALRDRARAAGFSAFTESVATDKGTLTRVRIGPVASRAEADQLQAQVQAKLGVAGIVRPHP